MKKEIIEDCLKSNINYHQRQEERGITNIDKSKSILKSLLDCHVLALGALEELMMKYSGIPGKTDVDISHKLSLSAAFYQGISVCEDTIKRGYYTSAAALVRQEFEIICALSEINKGNRKNKKVPNAKYLKGFGSLYGDLSGLTHLSVIDEINKIYSGVPSNIAPVTLIPVVDTNLCEQLYGSHLFFICKIIEENIELYKAMYNYKPDDKVIEVVNEVLTILVQKDILKIEE